MQYLILQAEDQMPEGIGYANTQILPVQPSLPTPRVENTEDLEAPEQEVETVENDQVLQERRDTSNETLGSQLDIFA